MKKWIVVVALLMFVVMVQSVFAGANSKALGLRTDFGDFIVPFQVVNGTELYSFREGKGFPGAETTLWTKGRYQVTFGAAPVLGTDVNVPFAGIQTRLSPALFDTSNNDLLFGVWVGRPSKRLDTERPRTLWGVKASIPLW